ncbi:hypothetical protein [Flavihumibacter sp. ZG627]|uniref:PKD domain-containing protein n=1 Tax=Flavihumibacter sp. ZG627 TaxID=1463156 RepID=UPI00057EDB60|nr:hypothetical protein [Flavihumibacter sp. ZG627]KIC92018.1 hypothetical protein HY58_00055 [Flavihumibacter sp. ZG627]
MKPHKFSFYIGIVLLVLIACNKNDEAGPFSLLHNKPPSANAGTDQFFNHKPKLITLDGIGKDPEGLILRFSWRLISCPPGFTIPPMEDAIARIYLPEYGEYIFEFKVTDKGGLKAKDIVKVTLSDVDGEPCAGCWDY